MALGHNYAVIIKYPLDVQGEKTPVAIDRNKQKKARSTSGENAHGAARQTQGNPNPDNEVGQALRSIYQQTVEEAVPAEMLDLLGKLG